jgi:hypothetical protein
MVAVTLGGLLLCVDGALGIGFGSWMGVDMEGDACVCGGGWVFSYVCFGLWFTGLSVGCY